MMLIVIPLLSVQDIDSRLSIATQLIHDLAVENQSNPEDYAVQYIFNL